MAIIKWSAPIVAEGRLSDLEFPVPSNVAGISPVALADSQSQLPFWTVHNKAETHTGLFGCQVGLLPPAASSPACITGQLISKNPCQDLKPQHRLLGRKIQFNIIVKHSQTRTYSQTQNLTLPLPSVLISVSQVSNAKVGFRTSAPSTLTDNLHSESEMTSLPPSQSP